RAKGSATFPSNFILVAAMNPCPCGNTGSKTKNCTCKPSDLDRYRRKLSGPIMDRIDLWVSVGDIDYKKLGDAPTGESSERIKERVEKARKVQKERFTQEGISVRTNSEMNVKHLERVAPLAPAVRAMLDQSAEALGLSARAYHRVIKIARTIADLDHSPDIKETHILEAIQYRPKVSV
ncbi:MAG: ATP-binding protein, partial [Candidatus Paceibacteria bacterium]